MMKDFSMIKKILGLSILVAATASLSACGTLPQCNDELDNCNRDAAYTEERTARAKPKMEVVVEAPKAAPVAEKIEAQPAPVKAEPKPAPVADAHVMQSAEPQFTHVSK